MRKKQKRVKAIAVLMIFAFFFSGCTGTAAVRGNTETVFHTPAVFADFVYEHPDYGAVQEKIIRTKDLVQKHEAHKALKLYNELLCDFSRLDTVHTAANIFYHFDMSDLFYKDEVLKTENELAKLDEELSVLTDLILKSPFAARAQRRWGKAYVCRFKKKNIQFRQDVRELVKREQELVAQYQQECAGKAFAAEAGDVKAQSERNRILGGIYLELVRLRAEKAEKLGYSSYTEYAYDVLCRDYTPRQAAEFCAEVRKNYVPLYRKITEKYVREAKTSMQQIRAVPTEAGLPVLREALQKDGYPAEMQQAFGYMMHHGFYDIGKGKDRMPAAYCTMLEEWGAPFLFINTDVYCSPSTLFHEFGHYSNFYNTGGMKWNDESSLDLAEVHSQGLEILMMNRYEQLYGKDAGRMRCMQILRFAETILQGCAEEEFQQEVYRNSGMTLEEINDLHGRIYEDYFGYPDRIGWTEIHHHFEVPFYYISYAVSAVSALELWMKAQQNRVQAMQTYEILQSAGANSAYRQTLKSAGMGDPFLQDCVVQTARAVGRMFGTENIFSEKAA